jgi:FAD/FMN-containing dehydrogenase
MSRATRPRYDGSRDRAGAAGVGRPTSGHGRRTFLRAGAGLAVAAGVVGGGWAASRAQASGSAWTALAEGLEGDLLRPDDGDYDVARKLFNPRFDGVRPAGIAYCASSRDVRECLAFAERHDVPVAVRSGGHSYGGWSTGKGLVVDVQRMDSVSASGSGTETETGSGSGSGSGHTATVGAGAKLIDVYDALTEHGRTIPAGSCPTVGVSGLTLGGGMGVVSRAYGLTSDSLIGARVVTADGRIRDVDADRDADLFWALRGAGHGNFGVVTALRFRTHAAPDCVAFFLDWPWSRAEEVLREWQRWAPTAPDEIWANLHLSAPAGGKPGSVSVGGLSLGGKSDISNRLDRLADRIGAPASSVSIREHTFMEAMKVMGGASEWTTAQAHQRGDLPGRTAQGRVQRELYAARSDFYTRAIPAEGIRALLARVERFGSQLSGGGAGSIAFDAMGGAANRVRPEATAFVHRDALFCAQYIASWPKSASSATVEAHRSWLNGTHQAMRSWASGRAYQNYADPALRDWRTAYYGSNAARLRKVKSAYDPDRLFSYPQAV